MSNRQRRSTRRLDRPDDATALRLGALFAALVGVSLWSSVVARAAGFLVDLVPAPGSLLLVSGAASLLGLAGGALVYARYRGIHVPVSAPHVGAWPAAAATIVAPAALVGGTAFVANSAFGVPLSSLLDRFVNPDASAPFLLWVMGVPSVFTGVGLGLLFGVLVPERVRKLVGAEDAVAVATLLVGVFWLLPQDAVGARLSLGGAVEFIATLVFGVAFAMAVGVLHGRAAPGDGRPGLDADALAPRHLVVLGLALLGLVGAATGLTSVGEVVTTGLWVAAFGLAVFGYERTRSAWVPVLALVGFTLALDAVVYTEALAGVSAV